MRAHVTKLAAARIDGDLEHTRLTAAEDLSKSRLDFFNLAHTSSQCTHRARYLVKGHWVALLFNDPAVELPLL